MSGDDTTDCQLHGLRDAFPGWRIWYVLTWDGTRSGVIWCARSPDGRHVLHADTAGDLAADISDTSPPGLAPGFR
jgi:hypothetical protein